MFKFPKFTRTIMPLLTGLLLAGCMDELDLELEADALAEYELSELELELGCVVWDEASTPDEQDEDWGTLDELDVPPLPPCDPPIPLPLDAPELADNSDEDAEGIQPKPLGLEAPELDDDSDDDDDGDDDDSDVEDEDWYRPFGIEAPELADDSDDCEDEDEDCEDEGDYKLPGLDAPELDGDDDDSDSDDEGREPPVSLDNPNNIDSGVRIQLL